jgi:hypothetical protein
MPTRMARLTCQSSVGLARCGQDFEGDLAAFGSPEAQQGNENEEIEAVIEHEVCRSATIYCADN